MIVTAVDPLRMSCCCSLLLLHRYIVLMYPRWDSMYADYRCHWLKSLTTHSQDREKMQSNHLSNTDTDVHCCECTLSVNNECFSFWNNDRQGKMPAEEQADRIPFRRTKSAQKIKVSNNNKCILFLVSGETITILLIVHDISLAKKRETDRRMWCNNKHTN